LVKKTFSQRLRGSIQSPLSQDTLAIFLSDQRLLYVVADHLGQPQLLKCYESTPTSNYLDLLQNVFSKDMEIRKTYSQSYLIFTAVPGLLEPNELSSEESDLSNVLLLPPPTDKHLSNTIQSSDIKVIYPVSETNKGVISQMFSNLSILHHYALWIPMLDAKSKDLLGNNVYAQIDQSYVTLFYYLDRKLQYVNQYEITSQEDLVYYIMLVYNQFGLDASNDTLHISVDDSNSNQTVDVIRSYIKEVELLTYQPVASVTSNQNSELNASYFFPLSAMSVLPLYKTA